MNRVRQATVEPDLAVDSSANADPRRWWALVVVASATFMALVDVFIVNVAAPSIQADFRSSNSALEVVLTGYTLIYGVGLVLGSRVGDRFGRKQVFLLGMAVFTAASLMCGLAPSMATLIGSRLLQGIGAALMVPQVFAFIQTTFPPAERQKAFSIYGVSAGLASVTGQSLGGALIGGTTVGGDWRLVFFVNVPVGTVAVAAGAFLLQPTKQHAAGGWNDLMGAAFLTGSLVGFTWPLMRASGGHWPGYLWPSEAAGVILGTVFVLWELRRKAAGKLPLLDPALFKRFSMALGNAGVFVAQGALASFLFVFAVYFQEDRGYSPRAAGLLLVAPGLGYALSSLAVAKLTKTRRPPLVAGSLLLAVGYGLLAVEAFGVSGGPTGGQVVLPILLVGLAMGLVFTPLINRCTLDVPPSQEGAASGVISTSIQLANVVGVALVGTLFLRWSGGNPHGGHAFGFTSILLVGAALAATVISALLARVEREASLATAQVQMTAS